MGTGKRIKDLRRSLGLTQVRLAGLVGITQGALSSIETGETHELKARTILKLARHLGTSPEFLKTGEGSPAESERPTPDEAEALHIFRALPEDRREEWLRSGRFLLSEASRHPTRANPFPHKLTKHR